MPPLNINPISYLGALGLCTLVSITLVIWMKPSLIEPRLTVDSDIDLSLPEPSVVPNQLVRDSHTFLDYLISLDRNNINDPSVRTIDFYLREKEYH